MSTLAYAMLTTKRQADQVELLKMQKDNQTDEKSATGVKTYVDALAALVPAEVLALHALILSVTTEVTGNATIISEPLTLAWAFAGLLLLSVGLYVAPRMLAKKWDNLDYLRMLIPPLSLLGWTMLQRATAFDAVFPDMSSAARTVCGLFLGVILGAAATWLSYEANQKPEQP
jgi:hypothetical protein